MDVWEHADDMWHTGKVPSIADLPTFLAAIEAAEAAKPASSMETQLHPPADRPRCIEGNKQESLQMVGKGSDLTGYSEKALKASVGGEMLLGSSPLPAV